MAMAAGTMTEGTTPPSPLCPLVPPLRSVPLFPPSTPLHHSTSPVGVGITGDLGQDPVDSEVVRSQASSPPPPLPGPWSVGFGESPELWIWISVGRGGKTVRYRRPHALAPPPTPGTSSVGFADWLGHHGMILVLFETPSGFALMHYDGVNLFLPKALENIWSDFINMSTLEDTVVFLEKFQIFKDKARAIKSDGLSYKLAKMIKSSLLPGQKLAVGKQEYKDIIEATLGVHCLFDEAVLELMWGLKNVIKVLVPDEKLELTSEDRLQISRGMQSVLDCYGFSDVDASLVNSGIIDMAYSLYECDVFEDGRGALLQYGSKQLEEVSGIDSKKWTRLKLATALKLICYPEEKIVIGDSEDILSKTEAEKLIADAHLYEDKIYNRTYRVLYKDIVSAHEHRCETLALLGSMVKEAKEDLKLKGSIESLTRLSLSDAKEDLKPNGLIESLSRLSLSDSMPKESEEDQRSIV